LTEAELVGWIRNHTKVDPALVPVGPGDDAAVVKASGRRLVVTVDTIAEGVDFEIPAAAAREVGRKAVAVNLSDLAAMGAVPICCVASAVLRAGLGAGFAKDLYQGMRSIAAKFDCPVTGGDLTGWSGGVVVTVTAIGKPAGAAVVTRSGARPGDMVLVTGTLGGSICGKHLKFTPRVAEGVWLARNFAPTAMIDISDGLGVDAAHIAAESGCRVVIDAAAVPISAAARRLAGGGPGAAMDRAVGDGEDFELLLAMPAARAQKCMAEWPFRTRLTRVGEVLEGRGAVLRHGDGREERIDSEGYQHF